MRQFRTNHQERQHAQGMFQSFAVGLGQGSSTIRFTHRRGQVVTIWSSGFHNKAPKHNLISGTGLRRCMQRHFFGWTVDVGMPQQCSERKMLWTKDTVGGFAITWRGVVSGPARIVGFVSKKLFTTRVHCRDAYFPRHVSTDGSHCATPQGSGTQQTGKVDRMADTSSERGVDEDEV